VEEHATEHLRRVLQQAGAQAAAISRLQ